MSTLELPNSVCTSLFASSGQFLIGSICCGLQLLHKRTQVSWHHSHHLHAQHVHAEADLVFSKTKMLMVVLTSMTMNEDLALGDSFSDHNESGMIVMLTMSY